MTPDTYKRSPLPKYIWVGVIFLVLIFVLSFGVISYNFSKRLEISASKSFGDLKGGVADLKQLDALGAEQKFRAAGSDFDPSSSGFLSKLRFFFGAANDTLSGFGNISSQGIAIAREVDFLQGNIFNLALDRGGDKIISSLKNIKQVLEKIDSEGNIISSNIGKFNSISEEFVNLYLPLRLNLISIDKFLDSFINWLDSDSTHHILVLLQNPSEIRPSGGFLGSYADVSVNKGNIENVEIHDINDADRLLETKIIPPKPLQAIVTNWRAADANWFFDFPASAEHVIKFMESSELYSGKSLTFDGAVALTPRTITDILSLMGPINLPQSKLSLNQDNLVLEIQREVQVGQSKKVTYPKKVLEEFSAALIAQVKLLDDQKNRELLRILQDRLQSRDIMLYFSAKGGSASRSGSEDPSGSRTTGGKNSNLQNLANSLDAYGLSGRVSDIPSDVAADYLAVVDANIGGGKSDLYVKQSVLLQSQMNADGTVTNHLTIDRKHVGDKAKSWWYKVANVDYLQIFTPPASHLVNFQGGIEKKIVAPANYSKNGYVSDGLVRKIESSEEKVFNYPMASAHDEFGKKVFATWVRTVAGGTSKAIFDYVHRLALAPADGLKYQFIFDKQAGAVRHYKFEISAPVGFVFRENSLPVYDYETDDPPGQLVLDLMLGKM